METTEFKFERAGNICEIGTSDGQPVLVGFSKANPGKKQIRNITAAQAKQAAAAARNATDAIILFDGGEL